jgi:superoxide dismutase, Fe-Mn family
MKKFEEQKFNIPELKGISKKTIEEHLKLYSGYVKNANLIQSMIEMYGKTDDTGGMYSVAEITRRFSFEFGGMRNHEYYFESLEGGAKPLATNGSASLTTGGLRAAIEKEWNSFDAWLNRFKTIALTRGVGWAMLYYDSKTAGLLNGWTDEQHIGILTGLKPILALDMWEHSYVLDYLPSGKKQYVEDFFANLNWEVIENNFKKAQE